VDNASFAPLADDPLWFKDAIIYQLHVKAFHDANGDGIGDFAGLIEKLDYVQELGVNTIWLLPFYPSPLRDDGYDIADYRGVNPDYGTMNDVRAFVREAHRRGLRVITELVINHTSDTHPWFQAARRAPPGSSKRNFYVWSDTDKKFPETRIIFTDTETSNWAWDKVAGQYYWHRFFSHQPDLNHNNPQVVKAVIRIMKFWLDMGVDGLRLDAIPYLCVREGTLNENLPETHAVIRQIRAAVDAGYRNRMLLAEANQWPEDVREYFGSGDECHMAYHFPLMPRMYMAVAMEDRHPIVEIMRQTPEIPDNTQWAIFLRNHDELTLEMVTDRERDYMYRMYAKEPRMRVNVGIRRRLAPLLENDRAKIELLTSLLMTMPGSPILYYGDEIGMGDNIYLGDRNGVRTPMQWSPDRNAGFSRADPQRLYLPPIMDPVYGYESINVEAQSRSPSSLLNWTRRMIAARKSVKAFGRGTLEFLEPGNRKILAYIRQYDDEIVLCVANLSNALQPVELDLKAYRGRIPQHLNSRTVFPPIGDLPYLLTLPAYGFYAFRLSSEAMEPTWHTEHLARPDLPVLVLVEGFQTFEEGAAGSANEVRRVMATRTRGQLHRQVILPFMEGRRWYAAKGRKIEKIELLIEGEWQAGGGSRLFTLVDVKPEGAEVQRYLLPLGVTWESEGDDKLKRLAPATLARVRQRERMGILYSALGDEYFCRTVLEAMAAAEPLKVEDGLIVCERTSAFAQYAEGAEKEPVHFPSLEQSNTTILFGKRVFVKVYRRLQPGENPELAMGRFLTEASPGARVVPVLGAITYQRRTGETYTLALAQPFVENQGDAWGWTLAYLRRFLDGAATPGASIPADPHSLYMAQMEVLGRRIAEMHRALAARPDIPAFAPEPVDEAIARAWVERVRKDLADTLARLDTATADAAPAARAAASQLLAGRDALTARLDAALAHAHPTARMRYHADLHLGQVLVVENDFVITDFEGEPGRPMTERLEKHSPLRDLAGMVRSFAYAAAASLREAPPADAPTEAARQATLVADWARGATDAFLRAYLAHAGLAPEDTRGFTPWLDVFVIEKALYEVRYEMDNRPAWLEIPLAGLVTLLAAPGADGTPRSGETS
jgi:maltose alpha-D-glucosyltransferase/alpha-amylase